MRTATLLLEDHAAAYIRRCDPAHNGTRNNQAFNIAGHLAAFISDPGHERLDERQILELVRHWNVRSPDPLDDAELIATVHSALHSGTPRQDKVVEVNRQRKPVPPSGDEDKAPDSIIVSARDLITKHPTLRRSIIDGLLREGETMNLVAASKMGKSWLTLLIALCIATGRTLFGRFRVAPGNVLIVDNELHVETSAHRLPKVAEALGLHPDEWMDRIHTINLRGRLRSGAAFHRRRAWTLCHHHPGRAVSVHA